MRPIPYAQSHQGAQYINEPNQNSYHRSLKIKSSLFKEAIRKLFLILSARDARSNDSSSSGGKHTDYSCISLVAITLSFHTSTVHVSLLLSGSTLSEVMISCFSSFCGYSVFSAFLSSSLTGSLSSNSSPHPLGMIDSIGISKEGGLE